MTVLTVVQWSLVAFAASPAILWALRRQRHPSQPVDWLGGMLGAVMLISVVADLGMRWLTKFGASNNWWVEYAYVPLQYALMFWAIAERRTLRWSGVVVILVLGLFVAVKGPLTKPETITQGVGGLLIGALALLSPQLDRYRGPIAVYFGLRAVLMIPLWVTWSIPPTSTWGEWYMVNHAIRALALGWMAWVIVQTPRPVTLEVIRADGDRHRQDVLAGGRRDVGTRRTSALANTLAGEGASQRLGVR